MTHRSPSRETRPSLSSFCRCASTLSRAIGTSASVSDGIDRGGDRFHGRHRIRQRAEHLLFALRAMLDVLVNQRGRIVDHGAVRRQRARRIELQHAFERSQILREAAAMRRRDDHRAALHQHVAHEQRARVGVPERQVIGRVARRVEHRQRSLVGVDDRSVLEPRPANGSGSRIRSHGNFLNRAAGQRA